MYLGLQRIRFFSHLDTYCTKQYIVYTILYVEYAVAYYDIFICHSEVKFEKNAI